MKPTDVVATISLLALGASANPLPTKVFANLFARDTKPTPLANTGKRGLAFNDPTLTQPFSLSGQNSRVSWAYNWGSQPYQDVSGQTSTNAFNPALHYIPMLWSNATVLTNPWSTNVAAAIKNYGADAVLGFNEPDVCGGGGSSCMSVNSSVDAWNKYIQPLAGKVSLVSPAVTNSPAPAGLTYLANFIKACNGCRIDAIALHWYGAPSADGAQAFINYIQGAYQQFQKPIYITEFGTNGGNDTAVMSFLKPALAWIANATYVTRAAFFWDSPGTGFLINSTTKALSIEGVLYNNYTGV